MTQELEPLQGRWYSRVSTESLAVERYLDVHDELFFRAVHFHRGGPAFKSQQAVFSIERVAPAAAQWQADLAVLRWVEDGADRSAELGGSRVRALCARTPEGLKISFSALDGPRPADLSSAEEYRRP